MRRPLALAAASVLAALAGGASAQTTYTVPSAQTPTLEFALNPAVTPVQAGDTIELTDAGFYLSTYTVQIPGLTIRGAAGQSVTVDGLGLGSVFTVTPAGTGVIFENLTITGGDGSGNSVTADSGTPESGSGGAIFAAGVPEITIDGCTFMSNIARNDGGAVYISGSTAIIADCVFTGNQIALPNGSDNGGALHCYASSVGVMDCTFTANSSNDYGGATYFNNCVVDVRRCMFDGNSTTLGAAMSFIAGSSGAVVNTVMQNNTGARGPGVHSADSWPRFTACEILNNAATGYGGGVFVLGETTQEVTLTSCLIAGNSSGQEGGGFCAFLGPDPRLFNCTVVGNTASDDGGAIANVGSGAGTIVHNSIIRDNTPNQYPIGATNVAFYCNVSGGELAGNVGTIDADPMFVSPESGDYRLMPGSPSIDAGDSNDFGTQAEPTDLVGAPRAVSDDNTAVKHGVPLLGLYVDQGAYEYQPPTASDCPADQNFNGTLEPADFSAWIANFNAGCP